MPMHATIPLDDCYTFNEATSNKESLVICSVFTYELLITQVPWKTTWYRNISIGIHQKIKYETTPLLITAF